MDKKLLRFEVPRASVDFLADELTGNQKLTVLKYLSLDETIEQIGLQEFGKTTTDNIPLEPVKYWVSKKWDKEFAYDLSKKNVPICFRASLAVALFTTKIAEYLTKLGIVEIYASKEIQEIYKKYNLPKPIGLTKIDYASLPPDVKRELVIPIVDNLYKAEIVAKAGLLFPNGVKTNAVAIQNPSLIFIGDNIDDKIYFDKITNLDVQASAAETCIDKYLEVKSLESIVTKHKKTSSVTKRLDDEKEQKKSEQKLLDSGKYIRCSCNACGEIEPKEEYEKGTTFFDIFPFKKNERKEDVIKAYRRLTGYGLLSGRGILNEDCFEQFNIQLREDGHLHGYFNFKYFDIEKHDSDFDMINDRQEDEYLEHLRRQNIKYVAEVLREEIDINNEAIYTAKAKYSQTSFIVEQGFLEVLTSKLQEELTKEEFQAMEKTVKEAKQTAGIYTKAEDYKPSTKLVIYSDKPVDEETLDLDNRILSAIKRQYHIDFSKLFSMDRSSLIQDNLGNWFGSIDLLLSKFRSVLINLSESFAVLELPPTKDEAEIKKQYRAIAIKTHPDKTLDLSPEEKLVSVDKFIKTKEAYDNIISRIGSYDTDSLLPTYYLGKISQLFTRNDI